MADVIDFELAGRSIATGKKRKRAAKRAPNSNVVPLSTYRSRQAKRSPQPGPRL